MFICAERATAGSSTGRFLSIGAEFFYVYDGDGNIVRSVDIGADRGYNVLGTVILSFLSTTTKIPSAV